MTTKTTLIAALVVTVAIIGAYFYPIMPAPLAGAITTNGSSSANTSKVAETTFAPVNGTTASSTSILNTDSQDRVVITSEMFCAGVTATSTGQSNMNFQLATTSVPNLGLQGNTNYVSNAGPSLTATPPSEFYLTQTVSATADFRRWAAGTYLTWLSSGATTTAGCIVDVKYLQGLGV